VGKIRIQNIFKEESMRKDRETTGRVKENEAAPDELGNDPREVGSDSAGQSGDAQRLSTTADANEESVEELAETDQAFEASAVRELKMRRITRSVLYIPIRNTVGLTIYHLQELPTEKSIVSPRQDFENAALLVRSNSWPSVALCFSADSFFFLRSGTTWAGRGSPIRSRASAFTAATARKGLTFFLRVILLS